MNAKALQDRNLAFALEVIRFCKDLPNTDEYRIIRRQLIRSSTSAGANYRAACRARSKAEFYSKLCIVVEEIDECGYWIEILEKLLDDAKMLSFIKNESRELLYIYSASRRKSKPQIDAKS